MINKRFSTSKKASKIKKRVLGMESLENRELLSINPLGYDGAEFVQTASTPVVAEAADYVTQADVVVLEADAPTGSTNATTSTSGVTTTAVTITWTKPTTYTDESDVTTAVKGVTAYTLTVSKAGTPVVIVDAAALKTKTSWAITGLDAAATETEYTYVVTAKLTLKDDGGSVVEDAKVASGEFKTEKTGDAAGVTVGPPTDIKTTFSKASSTKAAAVKVTWKAPANFIGGYTVTLKKDGTGTDITYTVKPGEKLEAVFAVGDTEATGEKGTLLKDETYTVVVTPTATTKIASSTTKVATGDVKTVLTTPDAPTTVAGAANNDVSFGVKVTVTPDSSGSAAPVGYWVGLYDTQGAADGAKVTDSNLIYVAAADIGDGVFFSDGKTSQIAAAIAVAADGGTAAVKTGAVAVGTEIAINTAYPAAAKSVKSALQADGSYKITWENALPKAPTTLTATSVKYEVDEWFVKYSSDGGKTWFSTGAAIDKAMLEASISGLVPGKTYTVAVEASVNKFVTEGDGGSPETFAWESPAGETARCKTATASVKVAAVKVATPAKAATPVPADDNTGLEAKVQWTAVAGTSYKIVVIDANKAVIDTDVKSFSDDKGEYDLTGLTPGAKYTVEVYALGSMPGTQSSALKIAVTATAFSPATAKVDSKSITMLTAEVTVTPPKVAATGAAYYLEFTSTVDGKNKPDWNAGWVEAVTDVTKAHKIAAQLSPSTQYFVRVVVADAPASDIASDWSNVTKIATGKETKFKTVSAPLATVTKPGYAMGGTSGHDIGFKFEMKTPSQNDKTGDKAVLNDTTEYTFNLFVADGSAKVDKITGKLGGAVEVKSGLTVADFEPVHDKKDATKVVGYKLAKAVTLAELGGEGFKLEGMKQIQFQLEVIYKDTSLPSGQQDFATLFTKAAKLSMPKWFV